MCVAVQTRVEGLCIVSVSLHADSILRRRPAIDYSEQLHQVS